MHDQLILAGIYITGAALSFYPLARFLRKEETFYDEKSGVACALICLLWPLIWSVWLLWYFLTFLEITFGLFIKPFQKAYDWCNRDNPLKKFGEFNHDK